jgi:uncharacterized membrane protein
MSKDENKGSEVEVFLEHHRFYSNRTWQYFGAILFINSFLLSSIKDLKDLPVLITLISYVSVIIIGVFYHLINWTDMRIDDNMKRVTKLLEKKFPEHKTLFENSMNWSKFGIFVITIPYFYLILTNYGWHFQLFTLIIIFLTIVAISERTRLKFEARNKMK